jgi:transposase
MGVNWGLSVRPFRMAVRGVQVRPQEALRDLDRAYANYWQGRKQGRRVDVPRFKKRGRCPDRFRLTGTIRVEDGAVLLPRIGRVQVKEPTGKFRALTVEVERPDPAPVAGPVVGVDRGVTRFAVCSDGTSIQSPRALERGLRTLRRRGRAVSRKRPGSANRRKAALAAARQHREDPQPARRCAAQGHHGTGESQVDDRGGRPQRRRDGPQPASGPRDQ